MHVDAAAGLLCAALLAASSAFGLDVVEVRDVHAVTDYADDSGMEKQLVRTDDALILRVIPGTQVIIR